MEFKTHLDQKINSNGTSYVGEIDANFSDLLVIFGDPTSGDGYKTDAEWELLFEDGTIATIYNWKNGKNYEGNSGVDTEEITDWHIGGNSNKALERVEEVLKENLNKKPKKRKTRV